MTELQQILPLAEEKLWQHRSGNRMVIDSSPRNPMFIACGGSQADAIQRSVRNLLTDFWSNIQDFLPSCCYTDQDKELPELDALRNRVESVRLHAADLFSNMAVWNVVNIVNASDFTGAEQLASYRDKLDMLHEAVGPDTSVRTMLIVLMDYRDRKGLLRQFLGELSSDKIRYDSAVVLTTRDDTGIAKSMDELYDLAANLLLLQNTNNDMAGTFSNRNLLTSSYFRKSVPVNRIAKQLCRTIAAKAQSYLGDQGTFDEKAWKTALRIRDGQCDFCTDALKDVRIRIPEEAVAAMPSRNPAGPSAASGSYTDVIGRFLADNGEKFITGRPDPDLFAGEICSSLESSIPLCDVAAVKQSEADRLLSACCPTEPAAGVSVANYMEDMLRYSIRKELYDRLCSEVDLLVKSAGEKKAAAREYCEKLTAQIGIVKDMGTIYITSAEKWLASDAGKASLCRVGYREDIGADLLECVDGILDSDRELYSLPFVEEWKKRINAAGTAVYDEIIKELSSANQGKLLPIPGIFGGCVEKKVYAFHTHDIDPNTGISMPTELYGKIHNAFGDVVGYMNLGRNDRLEAIGIYALDKSAVKTAAEGT